MYSNLQIVLLKTKYITSFSLLDIIFQMNKNAFYAKMSDLFNEIRILNYKLLLLFLLWLIKLCFTRSLKPTN